MKTSKKDFDLLVFIGRFQPYHNGHHYVITEALKRAENVLVLVGSANKLPDARNPFTFDQRRNMIQWSFDFDEDLGDRIIIRPLNDYPYDENKWLEEVQKHIGGNNKRIGLVGHAKDHSSYYLKMFPQYESVDVYGIDLDGKGTILDATYVRQLYYSHFPQDVEKSYSLVPSGTEVFLKDYYHSEEWYRIGKEIDYLMQYEADWGKGPFVTVDAVVVQAGHVLLIERGDFPGKGQLALPGGFVEPRERLEEAAMRELKEETTIDIPKAVLKNRIMAMQHFAHPYRSNRAHIITFAFLFDLDSEIDRTASSSDIYTDQINLPLGLTKVKGGDDAAKASWYPIASIKNDMMYEDHYSILQTMLDKRAIDKL